MPPAALIGALWGAPVGLILGAADGLVLYAMARVLGRLPRGEAPFRELGGAACALTSGALGYGAFSMMSRIAVYPAYKSADLMHWALLVAGPTTVATIAMWSSGRLIARRYARDSL